jgi:hypothetical protein
MMHQVIESKPLLDKMLETVSKLTMTQATNLLHLLGDYDRDWFTLTGTTYNWTLRNFVCYNNNKSRMAFIPITFEGGPTGHTKYKGSLATFVADRLLYSIKALGMQSVRIMIDEILMQGSNEHYAG